VTLLVALALGLLAAPLAAEAQPATKTPHIGLLAAGIPSTYTPRYEAFRQGLRDLGHVEGQTISFEYRYADGRLRRSHPETGAAKQVTRSIPIVFVVTIPQSVLLQADKLIQ
jgi:putative ABC transport system substrate-binding protein